MWWSVFERLLFPPAGPLFLVILGLLLRPWRMGWWLVVAGVGFLYAFSTPLVSTLLVAPLERVDPLAIEDAAEADDAVMVVLAGGWFEHAPEYDGPMANQWSLERAHYAGHLARELDVPVLVSGGPGEAEALARLLETGLGVAVEWLDNDSRNTQQNASNSAAILAAEDYATVILVTKALHFPRALAAFERAGVEAVIPAPTGYFHRPDPEAGPSPWDVVPSVPALTRSAMALHEYVGRVWYRVRY
ncbi:YdcF family protein [Aquisalimonas sp.]|uniref:YdcF family protein n=1 Tax=Aquisalimonas sp. TaxID=1872621 RepID=UPI0025C6951E|nr:YdcF family protein [Aquisalimonas sp.]